mmetsp:Transcript_36702/g.100963  ORF Transcript_36702/g.100963 Transcript_36702/m.100963 type:complete len:237 (+) Transcript_36702:2-712(+)
MTRPSHHGFDKVVELQLVVGFHLDLSAVVLSVAHSAHDLRGVVHARAIQKDVASLQLGLLRGVLWPHDEDTLHLSMGATSLVHVFQHVVVILRGRLVIHLQDLLDLNDRCRRLDLHPRKCQHPTWLAGFHHSRLHARNHSHRAGGVARSLDGNRDTKNEHAIELQGTLRLFDGGHLTETIICTLVTSEPDVEHWVLVRIVAQAPFLHGVIELLRKGILGDTEVVWQVAQVKPPHFP